MQWKKNSYDTAKVSIREHDKLVIAQRKMIISAISRRMICSCDKCEVDRHICLLWQSFFNQPNNLEYGLDTSFMQNIYAKRA